jgi:hypothetical protein
MGALLHTRRDRRAKRVTITQAEADQRHETSTQLPVLVATTHNSHGPE